MEIAVTSRLTEETEAVPEMFMDKVSVTEHEVILKQFELKRDEARGEIIVGIVVLSESESTPTAAEYVDAQKNSAREDGSWKATADDCNRCNACWHEPEPIDIVKLQIREAT